MNIDSPLTKQRIANDQREQLYFGQQPIQQYQTFLPISLLGNFANDAAAAAGGVVIGGFYRNGSVLQIRVT